MPLLTIPLVARRLGCAAAHVQRLAARGVFPGARRVSGEWRIPLASVVAFLAKPRKATVDPAAPRPVAARPRKTARVEGPQSRFYCDTLHCWLFACRCVERQRKSDSQRTSDTERGQAPQFVSCQTDRCCQGRELRGQLGAPERVAERPTGSKVRPQFWDELPAEQRAARDRLAAAGLLEVVPTMDGLDVEAAPGAARGMVRSPKRSCSSRGVIEAS